MSTPWFLQTVAKEHSINYDKLFQKYSLTANNLISIPKANILSIQNTLIVL